MAPAAGGHNASPSFRAAGRVVLGYLWGRQWGTALAAARPCRVVALVNTPTTPWSAQAVWR